MTSSGLTHEIAIVGAGMVGACAANLLARAGFSVALIDRSAPPEFSEAVDYGLRVSAISPGSASILDAAGAWPAIAGNRHCPYRHMVVENGHHADRLEFVAAAFGMERLGTIVENDLVSAMLWRSLEGLDQVDRFAGATITSVESGEQFVGLGIEGRQDIRAGLLLAADGAHSGLRKLAGIGQEVWAYNQAGVVCVVEHRPANPGTAWQRFLPGGPLAFLPLADGRSSLVWTCADGEARRLLALDEDAFLGALQAAAEDGPGEVLSVGPRAAFPLTMRLSHRYVADRLVLLGDAAHVVHPLAGQGVNLGLADVAALTEILLDQRRAGLPLEDARALQRFERWRRSESELMAKGIHALRGLFMNDAMTGLRGLGMRMVQGSWMARDMFLKRAAGRGRNAPALSRGRSLDSLLHPARQ